MSIGTHGAEISLLTNSLRHSIVEVILRNQCRGQAKRGSKEPVPRNLSTTVDDTLGFLDEKQELKKLYDCLTYSLKFGFGL